MFTFPVTVVWCFHFIFSIYTEQELHVVSLNTNKQNENTIKYKYFPTSSGFSQNPELKYWMSSTYKSEFENRIPLVGYALADGFFDVAFRQDEEYFFIFIKNAVNNSAYAPWPAGGVYVYYLDKIN